jgi:hypothetical protein
VGIQKAHALQSRLELLEKQALQTIHLLQKLQSEVWNEKQKDNGTDFDNDSDGGIDLVHED